MIPIVGYRLNNFVENNQAGIESDPYPN